MKNTTSEDNISVLIDGVPLRPAFQEIDGNITISLTNQPLLSADKMHAYIEQALDAEVARLQGIADTHINKKPNAINNLSIKKHTFTQQDDETTSPPENSQLQLDKLDQGILLGGTEPPLLYEIETRSPARLGKGMEKDYPSPVIILTFQENNISVRHALLYNEQFLDIDVWRPEHFENTPAGAERAILLAQERLRERSQLKRSVENDSQEKLDHS